MSDNENRLQSAEDEGYEDVNQDRYNPPDGTGFIEILNQALTGQTDADKAYHKGRERAKLDGK